MDDNLNLVMGLSEENLESLEEVNADNHRNEVDMFLWDEGLNEEQDFLGLDDMINGMFSSANSTPALSEDANGFFSDQPGNIEKKQITSETICIGLQIVVLIVIIPYILS